MEPPGAPRWRVVAASATGSAHLADGSGCQDAFVWRGRPDGTVLVAVADGAGSAARSREGADAAVRAAADALEEAAPQSAGTSPVTARDAMARAFAAARRAIEDTAGASPPRELACTLSCVVAGADGLLVGQIGDGLVVARDVDGGLFCASRPQKGAYANESAFLTAPDAPAIAQIRLWTRPIDAFVVLTDGVLRLAVQMPGLRPHGAFFGPLLAHAASTSLAGNADAELERFLGSERVRSRTDDDATVVVAVRVRADAGDPS